MAYDPALYASTGSIGDPMDLYGQPTYGEWNPGAQLLPSYMTPDSVYNYQPTMPPVVHHPAPAYEPHPVHVQPLPQPMPAPMPAVNQPRGRPLSPEECALRGLPPGSMILDGPPMGAPPRGAPMPAQQPVGMPPMQQPMQQPVMSRMPYGGPMVSVPRASIGASFTKHADQHFYCDAVTPGSSAAASGLQIGMMLEKVNRTRVSGYAPAQVAEMLTGMEGSMLLLRFRDRNHQIQRRQIVRDCHAEDKPYQPAPAPAPAPAPVPAPAPAPPLPPQPQFVQAPPSRPAFVQANPPPPSPQVPFMHQPPHVEYVPQPVYHHPPPPPPVHYMDPYYHHAPMAMPEPYYEPMPPMYDYGPSPAYHHAYASPPRGYGGGYRHYESDFGDW